MGKILLLSLIVASPLALAGPQCTTAERSQWQDPQAFQEQLKAQGYQISKFKVTDQDSGATIATGTTIGNRRIMSVAGNIKSVFIEFEPADAKLKKVTAYARR